MTEQSWRASNGSVFDASGCIAVCDTDNADAATYAKRATLMAAAPELLAALKASEGYLLNAKIDLETGAPKSTAIRTIDGGLRIVRAALKAAEGAQ